MGRFQIPLNPKLEASTLIIEKCRYMSSKMVPLWLVFKNVDDDAPPIYIIFKVSISCWGFVATSCLGVVFLDASNCIWLELSRGLVIACVCVGRSD